MCGIFAYTGTRTATPILVDGLRALEYRGYDSAGVFIPQTGAIKAVGAVDNLAKKLNVVQGGTAGIAHTRWATHGAPTEVNAHPHTGSNQLIWVVHNGIIENHQELKGDLIERGHTFLTDTDTEVLAHLIESYVVLGMTLVDAVRQSLRGARGTYGLAVMNASDPNTIVAARLGSPIVIGVSEHGNFVSSDASGLLPHTKDVVYLDDGEIAVVTKEGYQIATLAGEAQNRKPEKIEWDEASIQKDGFEHFMLKEIMEIPRVVEDTLRGRVIVKHGKVKLGGLESILSQLTKLDRLTIVACGSASIAGEVGKYIIEEYLSLPVDVEIGSEYRYRAVPPNHNSAVLAISQSGETADTLASVRKAKELGLPTFSIVNVVGSTLAREVDHGVFNHAGPEVSIASTKAVVSQVLVLILIALLIGRERGMSEEQGKEIIGALQKLPKEVEAVLKKRSEIEAIAKKYTECRDAMFIGRNLHAPIAREGALKLKEVSYVHAEAYPGGELKHGPIAMLDEQFPVIALAPEDEVYEKMCSNIEEVRARKAPVFAIGTVGDVGLSRIADDVFLIPKVHHITQPILSLVPLYLFAYYVGIHKGINVDRPRNLAKSVTVE